VVTAYNMISNQCPSGVLLNQHLLRLKDLTLQRTNTYPVVSPTTEQAFSWSSASTADVRHLKKVVLLDTLRAFSTTVNEQSRQRTKLIHFGPVTNFQSRFDKNHCDRGNVNKFALLQGSTRRKIKWRDRSGRISEAYCGSLWRLETRCRW
jgi:hypothetical protein